MKRFLTYTKGNRIIAVMAPLLKMAEATLELIVPLIVAELIDTGIAQGNKKYILLLCLQMAILGFTGFIISVTAQYFSAKTAVNTVSKAKIALYDKIQHLSFTQLDSINASTLITRLTSDMDSVQTGINLTLRLLLRSPFVVAGACIMAFRVSPKASAVFGVSVPAVAVIIAAVMLITIPMNTAVRAKLDSLLLSARENAVGFRVIRAFGAEKQMADEFRDKNALLALSQIKTGRISALLNPLTQVIINTGIAALIYSGALQIKSGVLTAGALIALYNYMLQILIELIKFVNLVITIVKSFSCAKRISGILDLDTEERIIEDSETSDYFVEFRDVSFSYEGSEENSLENISFTAGKGGKIGIIGSTGSGKTTLINLLCGFYRPTGGKIFTGGSNILSQSPCEVRGRIAVCEQKPVIFKGTVRSNLTLGNQSITDETLDSALKAAQAYDFVYEKGGLDAPCEQFGRNFSGGQKQRLAIARALAKQSEILILDDSFSSLDYATEAAIRKAVSSLDILTFTVSQRTGSVADCDLIICLENGKAETGTHKELLEKSAVYREIRDSQNEEGAADE